MAKDSCSLVFTGDIGFDRYMAGKWTDEELLSPAVLRFFHSADHVIANVEGALIDAVDDGSRGVFFHSMDPAATQLLARIRSDIWSIGNNHTMDAGADGIISTRNLAAGMGCRTFGDVRADQYELLAPLGAKAFLTEECKKMIYLEPERFTDAPQEGWDAYFYSTEPDGYFEGEHMDLSVIVPFAKTAEEGAWKESTLEGVKQYMLAHI